MYHNCRARSGKVMSDDGHLALCGFLARVLQQAKHPLADMLPQGLLNAYFLQAYQPVSHKSLFTPGRLILAAEG